MLGEFVRATGCCAEALSAARRRPCRWLWGFCSIRRWLAACRRRVRSLMMQFPPSGDGEAATRGCVVPKVQTTSEKSAENGLLRARWSAFWAHRCQS